MIALKPLEPSDDRKTPGFAVCDIESSNWINFLVIGLAWKEYDDDDKLKKQTYRHFLTMSEFCDFVFSKEQPHENIFAHFGGKFDFNFVLKEFFNKRDKYFIGEMIPRGSGLLCFDVSTFDRLDELPSNYSKSDILGRDAQGRYLLKVRTISFRDSSAMLPFGLGSLTENFGVEHKKKEIDYEAITKVDDELLEYLEYDCWGLYEVIERYFRWPMIKSAGPAFTVASQALRVFRTFMKTEISSLPPNIDAFVRSSYFGGRTEIFKPFFEQHEDNKLLKSWDVNSLYPATMREFSFPVGYHFETDKYLPDKMGFYDVEVFVPDMYIPPLGVRYNNLEDKLIFPTGKFRGVWSTCDLNHAISIGCKILKVHKGLIFKDGGPIFREYVEYLYQIRKNSDKASVSNVLAKLLMNSTYGRTGLNLEREQLVFDDGSVGLTPYVDIPLDKDEKEIIRLMTKSASLDSSFSNVAIAAWVTSQARVWMHKLYMDAPEEVYYTDSITKERMVMVMNEKGHISIKSMQELWAMSSNHFADKKEYAHLRLKTLSYNAASKSWEWKKIEKIIRHKVDKPIVRSRSNKGSSVTTTDHSYIDDEGLKVSPEDLKTHFSPKTTPIPKGKLITSIDLLDWIDNSDGMFEFNEDWIWAKASDKAKRQFPPIKLKRKYFGSDLKDFCALAGYYVTEGSASIRGRPMFSISSEKYEFQEFLKKFLNSSICGTEVKHIKSSKKDNCMALRSGTKTMAFAFARLFGVRSKLKRLPDFVFNLSSENQKVLLDAMILGDGSRKFGPAFSQSYREKNFTFCTQSFTLINQLCGLMAFSGQCYSIHYRKEKTLWTLTSSSKNRIKKPDIEEVKYDDYVYDLQVKDNNNFFDCEGMIGLHNTDSIKSTFDYPRNDDDLGQLKLEYKSKRACFILPKTYIEETLFPMFKTYDEKGREKKGVKSSAKIVMKGFDKRKISKFTTDDFTAALEGDLRRLRALNPRKFATLKTAISKKKFLELLDESPKQIRSKYHKRRIYKRAYAQVYDSEPLHIKDGEIVNLDKDVLKKWKDADINVEGITNAVLQRYLNDRKIEDV